MSLLPVFAAHEMVYFSAAQHPLSRNFARVRTDSGVPVVPNMGHRFGFGLIGADV